MTLAKKFFKKNSTYLLVIALIFFLMAIFIPVEIKDYHSKTSPTPIPANLVLETVPDQRPEVKVPILMYHHVRNYDRPEDPIGTALSVTPENFKAQTDYLKNNGYTTITFNDLVGFPKKSLPEKPVILTFDDGYRDNYDIAYKQLRQNGQVGVFYVITNFLEKPEHLTKGQVVEMASTGMEIGSHTSTHPSLTKIDINKAKSQLKESKAFLENLTSKQVISFCYPSGNHSPEVSKAVEETEYLTATTTVNKISSTSENKFLISRIRINANDSINSFIKNINK